MEVEKDTDANEEDEVNPLVETVTNKPALERRVRRLSSALRNEEVNVGMEEFVPGNQFVFEDNLLSDTDNVDPSTLINKRKKKSGLGNLGRPNPAYSSSLEKTKVGKKPKCNDDLFGLDSLLGLDTEALDDADVAHIVTNDIDLNSQPGTNGEVGSVTADQPLGNNSMAPINEVEATINLGSKLGVNLLNSHKLIHESIVLEGVQGGKE
ncbi:hypothetical protein Hanom_Chr09g00759421 [Helianthus anomalus]